MDLAKINLKESAEAGADMELEHPVSGDVLLQDNGNPITIKLAGTDSKQYRAKQRELGTKRMTRALRRSRKPDLSVSDEDACSLLAACTLGWDGIIIDGKTVEFNDANAYDLYMDQPWVREQVDIFIGDRANFFSM